MFCPTCQVVVRSRSGPCPACGTVMRVVTTHDAIEVVDASSPVIVDSLDSSALQTHATYDVVTTSSAVSTAVEPVNPRGRALTLLARLPELSLQAWQQPVVRSAVRTGLGAVALSLAARGARRMVQGQVARRGLAASISPSLVRVDDVLRATGSRSRQPAKGRRAIQVSETIIIIRRAARQ